MIQEKKLDIILTSSMNSMKFFSLNQNGVGYRNIDNTDIVNLYDGSIMEYDLDVDGQGNIGLVFLDSTGKLHYYFYDGRKWSTYSIHHFNLLFEEIKDLSIRFSVHTPIITFCSRNHSSSNQWSISTFQKLENSWKRDVIAKVYLSADTVPYKIVKDRKDNLYLFYLSNHNIVYDINIMIFHQQSQTWSQPLFLNNCIFIKYFHIDALVDANGGVHVIWIDKYKKNYCIKYSYRASFKGAQSNPSVIMEFTEPLVWTQLYMTQQSLYVYGLQKERVYSSSKPLKNTFGLSKWQQTTALSYEYDQLTLYKSLGSKRDYMANYILTPSGDEYRPIPVDEIETSPQNSFIPLTNHQGDEFQRPIHMEKLQESMVNHSNESNDILRYKGELFKKNQQLEVNQGLLKSLQGELSFMKQEIRTLQEQHKKSTQFLNDAAETHRKFHERLDHLNQIFESRLSQMDLSEVKKKLEILSQEVEKSRTDVTESLMTNKELKEAVEALQRAGLFRKIFS